FLGIFFAVIEFRNLIKYQPKLVSKHITKEEKNKRLAMFVSDLFEEDISFEELEKNKNQNEPIDP
ncbi:MAG: hypothetical protein IH840_09910, partial [Candidatus Heimdallarchaeota archaeon]|nr:hypothetical protein [Candidatus Heimdallarchaeota archaeon]